MPVLLEKPAAHLAKPTLDRPASGASRPSSGSTGGSLDPTALKVVIVSCKGLRNADWMPGWGSSDPYCICSIVGKPEQKFRTKAMQNTLSPIWNHHGQLSDFEPGDALEFKVFDKDLLKKDDLLGSVTLPSDAFLYDGFSGELPLSNAGKDVLPFLRIRVEAPCDRPPLPPPVLAPIEAEDQLASCHQSQVIVMEVMDYITETCPQRPDRMFWCF